MNTVSIVKGISIHLPEIINITKQRRKGILTTLPKIINATKQKKVKEKNIRLLIADKTISVLPPILVDKYAADWKG